LPRCSLVEHSEWLAGQTYSLADTDFAPYLQRMKDLGLGWMWENKQAVRQWYAPASADFVQNLRE